MNKPHASQQSAARMLVMLILAILLTLHIFNTHVPSSATSHVIIQQSIFIWYTNAELTSVAGVFFPVMLAFPAAAAD